MSAEKSRLKLLEKLDILRRPPISINPNTVIITDSICFLEIETTEGHTSEKYWYVDKLEALNNFNQKVSKDDNIVKISLFYADYTIPGYKGRLIYRKVMERM